MDDYDAEDVVFTNATTNSSEGQGPPCPYDYCVRDTLYRMVVGSLLFVLVWPFVVQDVKFFPLGRPAAALLGATLMVVFNVVPQAQVYHVLGEAGNLQAICLLVSMMMLSHYYHREGLLDWVAAWVLREGNRFRSILWKVCVLSAVMSAILTNDATCVVLTPLLLKEHARQKRSAGEIPPLLLGIATSANIGSASTFFGNPQNAFIASQAGLSLLTFFITSLPAAVIGVVINTGLLYLVYYKAVFRKDNNSSACGTGCVVVLPDHACVSDVGNGFITPPTASMSVEGHNEQHDIPSSNQTWSNGGSENLRLWQNGQNSHHRVFAGAESSNTSEGSSRPAGGYQECETSLSGPCVTDIHYGATNTGRRGWGSRIAQKRDKKSSVTDPSTRTKGFRERQIRDKIFTGWLGLVTLLMIVLLAIPPLDHLSFNLGLVPVGAAVFTMLVDTLLHHRHSRDAITNVDWTIILMFFGLFVWLVGFENTSLPRRVFRSMNRYMNLSYFPGVMLFTVFVIIGSNILSNVPLVILILDELETFECGLEDCSQLTGVLLAWVSTVAGNFTLIGSVANLIVAEKAKSCANYNLTFLEYLKFGLPSTMLVLFTGLPVVYFTGKYVSINII